MGGPKKRTLRDLYITGREVRFNDESGGDPVVVWMQKLNAIETETVARRAGAARSRVLRAARDQNSDEFQDAYNDIADYGRETLVDIVISEDLVRTIQATQAEIAAEEEWSKDDYLQGLRDAWFGINDDGGLKFVYEADDKEHEDYEESVRVFNEINRYDETCQKRVDGERDRLKRDLEHVSLEQLRDDAVKRNLSLRGDVAWINEYKRSQLYFGVRDPQTKKPYFDNRDEVDQLHSTLLERLHEQYDALSVEATEGKDLPPIQDSSQPSEPAGTVETAASSGPVTAAA